MQFQIYDIYETRDDYEYYIYLFGRTTEGKSIFVKVKNYKPYFYAKFTGDVNISKNKNNKYTVSIVDVDKLYIYNEHLVNVSCVRNYDADGFNNNILVDFYKFEFDNIKHKGYVEKNLREKFGDNIKFYESNISPFFKFLHETKISGCGWINVDNYVLRDVLKESRCDIEIIVEDYTKLEPLNMTYIAKFIIASYDIECNSSTGDFPDAKNDDDYIIQIGITYTYLGESIPFRKYICCLDKTDEFDQDVIVESYEKEVDILDAFCREIKRSDCDILIGHNIYNFDEKYIYDRCRKNKLNNLHFMSKLVNHNCGFINRELSSKALGDNYIRYYDTPGILHLDLMKIVQANTKLDCYKLDYLASLYIRSDILKIDGKKLYCKTVDDVFINDYIHIEINKGFVTDLVGEKYLIKEIDRANKILIINEEIKVDKECKLIWTQAKDDISPKDIFKYFKENSHKRAIVAKYCIKDCSLVSLLQNKLNILINGIEMANVCSIPLSYVFIRGQGIRSLSLSVKEYNDNNYLFPTKIHIAYSKCSICKKISKYNKCDNKLCEDGDMIAIPNKKCVDCNTTTFDNICPNCNSHDLVEIDNSYEGAIVFDPYPCVEYDAIVTKDYNSLYPSSIIHQNISHETIIENLDYLKLVNYNTIEYIENDGSIKLTYFYKDKKGVMPIILERLLSNRKLVKKAKDEEPDKFKKLILDAKQLALKLVANSVYGSFGAKTSPIFKRELAACTTAVGRQMLIVGKKFDEELLPFIFNSYKYYNNDKIFIDKLLKGKKINNNFDNIIINPIVRYGDTDSNFTCYKIKENAKILDSHEKYKKILFFSKIFIKSLLKKKNDILYITSYEFKFNENEIPIIDVDGTNISKFWKEFIEESYYSWLWTIQEIIENKIDNLNYKYYKWGIHLLEKHKIEYIDMTKENIKQLNDNIKLLEMKKKKLLLSLNELNNMQNDKRIYDIFIVEYKKIIDNDKKIIKSKNIINGVSKQMSNLMCEKFLSIDEYNDLSNKNIKLHYKKKTMIQHILDGVNYVCNDIEYSIDKKKINNSRYYNIYINIYRKIINIDYEYIIKKRIYDKIIKRKNKFELKLHNFIIEELANISIQPYYDINMTKKINLYYGGNKLNRETNLKISIELGKLSSNLIELPYPHKFAYEKTFSPFMIISKKKYVGNKYEEDYTKFYQDSMGIVLKRRDNAPIVKEICSGVINIILNAQNKYETIDYLKLCIKKMFNNEYDIKYFCFSKNVKNKNKYKNWQNIAHIVLVDRILNRDIGKEIHSGDRIEYAFIKNEKGKLLGDSIETPEYIKTEKLELDYMYYLTNQIKNPVSQFLELVCDDIEGLFNIFKIQYTHKYYKQYPLFVEYCCNNIREIEHLDEYIEDVINNFKKSKKKNMTEYLNYYTNEDKYKKYF